MRRIAALALVAFVLASAPAQTPKRPITDTDLFSFVWIGDTQLSPSGNTLCFAQTTVAPDRSGYQTALYLLDLTRPNASPIALSPGPHDSSPRWSPDGKQIAFLRAAEKTGTLSPPAQLYVMPATPGASALKLTDFPKGVSALEWTGNLALTVKSSTPRDPAKALAANSDTHISDVRIVNRVIYRYNGEGNLDPNFVPQLYMVFLPDATGKQAIPWQLTGGRFGVDEFLNSPTGRILYTTNEVDEPVFEEFPHTTLHTIVPLGTASSHSKERPPSTSNDLKLAAQGLAISPDGNHLAFHAAAEAKQAISHAVPDLWVIDLEWNTRGPVLKPARNLTAFKGFEMGSGVVGDNFAPRAPAQPAIQWSADSTQLLDIAGSKASTILVSIDAASGDVTRLSARRESVIGFNATPDQKTIYALISNPILIGDLFRVDPAVPTTGPGNQTQLTHVNDALFAQLDLKMPEFLSVTPKVHATDIPFVTIDTFVQLPPGMDATSKVPHPFLLNIHGGPHSSYGWVFDHEILLMAARGYVVDYPNPRGSTTYGQNFATIIENNYPGDDFHDLMDTVDAVIAKGWADPAKLGVTGGSGGGLLTDWTVTQTNRFKAAVAQRDITDWANWWYTSDIPSFHQSFQPKSPPFDNLELYRAHSPLTFVNNVKTPMMFVLGDADDRTPPGAGGEDFFRALKYKRIPTVMIRFPRENHELSRSGEPWHRVERLDNILNWFDEFLLNKCEPQYDINPTCKP